MYFVCQRALASVTRDFHADELSGFAEEFDVAVDYVERRGVVGGELRKVLTGRGREARKQIIHITSNSDDLAIDRLGPQVRVVVAR